MVKYYSMNEAAKYIGVSQPTISEWVKDRKINPITVSHGFRPRYIFKKKELDRAVNVNLKSKFFSKKY